MIRLSTSGHVPFPSVIHVRARTIAHEKVLYFEQGDDVRDRFDTSATSLSNSMIRMPTSTIACCSLSREARMREFDSRLASRCLLSLIAKSKLIR